MAWTGSQEGILAIVAASFVTLLYVLLFIRISSKKFAQLEF